MSDIFLIDRKIAATEIKSCLKGKYQKIGRFRDYFFDNFSNMSAVNDSSLIFLLVLQPSQSLFFLQQEPQQSSWI